MTRASSPVNNGRAKIALGDDTALTLSQKGRGNPFDPANYGEIVKPGELVDIVELSPLTLADRRIYNLLIANAWERISEPVIHRSEEHTSELQSLMRISYAVLCLHKQNNMTYRNIKPNHTVYQQIKQHYIY